MPSKAQIEHVQQECNAFTSKYLAGVQPLIVDGDYGPATKDRIKFVKWYLGYGRKRDAQATEVFRDRMRKPRSPKHSGHEYPVKMRRAGAVRRGRQRARFAEQRFRATVAPNVTTFDGKPCAVWLARICQKVRDAGRWKGGLNSGWRSPAYSKSLCQNMCGADSCPGRCAGIYSNHSGSVSPAGAVDVSDYVTFEAELKRLGQPIKNELDARDRVHFSSNGR